MKYPHHYLPANKSWVRRLLSPVAPINQFWMTYRLPFQKFVYITHPPLERPYDGHPTVKHEMFHVRQFQGWYSPFWMILLASLFPLPILLSGRWFIEREAYLADILSGSISTEGAVNTLWHYYGWCWPKSWMTRWFDKRVRESVDRRLKGL